MLENSVDASSTSIEIIVKDGGLKLLQITDNGSGINKEDLPILCQRFTTSKLREFEDLNKLTTYGFRGEALASISHIAHLTVTTKQKDSPCAWKALFIDGKQVGDPKAIAGREGTIIQVEDLFYNVTARKRAFKSKNDEYSKILDVVGRYAIHCTHVSFSCKKSGDTHPSLIVSASRKNASNSSNTKQKPVEVDRIRQVYGSAIANELITVDIPARPEYGFLGGKGQITSANYSAKKSIPPVFFINHRSVACDPLRRAILQGVYSKHLPKGGHAFVYLALDFDPRNLDVNIHPTKRDVRFLFEDEVIDMICTSVQEVLAAQGSSRTFQTQTVLTIPGVSVNKSAIGSGGLRMGQRSRSVLGGTEEGFNTIADSNDKEMQYENFDNGTASGTSSRPTDKKKVYEHYLVRTDHAQGKLPALFRDSAFSQKSIIQSHRAQKRVREEDEYTTSQSETQRSEKSKTNKNNNNNYDDDGDIEMQITSQVIDSRKQPSQQNEITQNPARDDTTSRGSRINSNVPSTANQITSTNFQTHKHAKEQVIKQGGITIPGSILFVQRDRVDMRLSSVRSLKKEVEAEAHDALTEVISKMTFVGVVDHKRRLMAFQHDIRLYMVDYGLLSQALFYQTALAEFSNLGTITLQSETSQINEGNVDEEEEGDLGLRIKDILGPNVELDQDQVVALWEMRGMLREYFSIRFATPAELKRLKKKRARMIERLSQENEDLTEGVVIGADEEEEEEDVDDVIERPVLEDFENSPNSQSDPNSQNFENSQNSQSDASSYDLQAFQQLEQEYFSLTLSAFQNARLVTLPMLLKGYVPPIPKLAFFVQRLLDSVPYDDETECFRSVLTHLAQFYAPEPVLDDEDEVGEGNGEGEGNDLDEGNNTGESEGNAGEGNNTKTFENSVPQKGSKTGYASNQIKPETNVNSSDKNGNDSDRKGLTKRETNANQVTKQATQNTTNKTAGNSKENITDNNTTGPFSSSSSSKNAQTAGTILYRRQRRREISDLLCNVICPAAKMRLLAPKRLLKDVVEVANLPGLYKVFERC